MGVAGLRLRAASSRAGALRAALLPAVALLIMLFMFAPIVVVVGAAFNTDSSVGFPPDGLSLRWFREMLSDPQFRSSLGTSAALSATVAVLAATVGTAFAFGATRARGRWFVITASIANLPMILPGVFIGVALFSAFVYAGVAMSARTALLGQLIYVLPFVIAVTDARLRGFDISLEEAARVLGYSRLSAFVFVTLRMAAPAILGASVLAFALSFDEVYITNFIVGQDSTLPVYVLAQFRTGIDPRLNAVAVVLLVLPLLVVSISAVARRFGEETPRVRS